MRLSLDLNFSENQEAIRSAVDRFCEQHDAERIARQSGEPFPRDLWHQLAGLGVFSPAAPGNAEAGGALEICAINERLGHHVFPGPIASTFLAIQVLDFDEVSSVIDGRSLVSVSNAGSTLLPFGTEAQLFLVVDNKSVARAHKPQKVEPVSTLGGEIWGRATLSVDQPMAGADRGLLLGNICAAAYLTGAAWHLIHRTSEHAAIRKQFGKTLGEFQAVSHPLADAAIGISSAQVLTRAAASYYDEAKIEDSVAMQKARCQAAGALVSARRASLQAAFTCHQVFAGIGITLEGPVFHFSRRIRQLVSTPPTGVREQELLLADAGLGA